MVSLKSFGELRKIWKKIVMLIFFFFSIKSYWYSVLKGKREILNFPFRIYRSSCWQMFFKIVVLKNSANFTGKHLCWSHFLIKLQAWGSATLLKRDSNTDVFLWNKQNFTNTYFKEHLQTTADQMICNKILEKIRALLWI